jgi:hypothetical protein
VIRIAVPVRTVSIASIVQKMAARVAFVRSRKQVANLKINELK